MRNILMIGPDLKVRGGVSSVENIIVGSANLKSEYKILFLPTHKDVNNFRKLLFAVLALIKFIIVVTFRKIDVVYIHMSHGASFFRKSAFLLVCSLLKKSVIIHMHGSNFDEFFAHSRPIVKRYIKFISNTAAKVIVLSEEWKKFYISLIPAEKLAVIHNSVDVPDKMLYDRKNRKITLLGRLDKRKGVYDILDIMPDIAGRFPDTSFVLAGDGNLDDVRRSVKEKGLEAVAEIPGWVESDMKNKILEDTCIYLLPSYAEGLPMSVLEAMSYGIPVITTNVGGLTEVIENGVDGILIKPGDKAALKENLSELLSDEKYRLRISRNCYNKVASEYNADTFIKKVSEVFDQCI